MEIEAKFRVEQAAIFADLLAQTRLGTCALVPTPGIEHQNNTYFDTPDRRLTSLGYSLRVRDLGRRRIGALKRSLSSHAGIHTREEWEIELGPGDHPRDWPASPARARALALLGDAALAPLVRILTKRQYMYAIRDAAVIAELSLDEGTILAGERSQSFLELEVELLDGQPRAELDALVRELRARYPLTPEHRGKKSRGLALLDAAWARPALERAVAHG
jgi:inorganic triphosphatase YgiF